jgi:hypothetical protein
MVVRTDEVEAEMHAGQMKRLFSVAVAGTFAVGLLAGCGGGSSKPKTPAFNEATAMSQVTTNWETFFSAAGSVDTHVALMENGEALRQAYVLSSKNPLAKQAKTTVTKVVIDPDHTTATVTYDILIGTNKVVNSGSGQAVLQGGTWKVSQGSFCALATAGAAAGQKIPGCS